MILGGPKEWLVPMNGMRGQNNNFGGTNDLEFEGTNDFGGTERVLKSPSLHFLVNLGLQKYNKTHLVSH